MPTYRIFLQGYVDCMADDANGRPPPETHATIMEYLTDMSLAIGDIEELQLSSRPLTEAEEKEEGSCRGDRSPVRSQTDAAARAQGHERQETHDPPGGLGTGGAQRIGWWCKC